MKLQEGNSCSTKWRLIFRLDSLVYLMDFQKLERNEFPRRNENNVGVNQPLGHVPGHGKVRVRSDGQCHGRGSGQ